jgi:hypothetical protein
MGINYGLNRVRFTSPVAVGSQLRASFAVASVTDVDNAGVQVVRNVTLERRGNERPVCVAVFRRHLHYPPLFLALDRQSDRSSGCRPRAAAIRML